VALGHAHVRVTAQDAGSAFLLEDDEQGRLRPLFVPAADREARVTAGGPTLLPPGEPLSAGQVDAAVDRELIVLVRRRAAHPTPALREKPPSFADALRTSCAGDDDAPVRVVGGSADPEAPALDGAVARLLSLARTDPPG